MKVGAFDLMLCPLRLQLLHTFLRETTHVGGGMDIATAEGATGIAAGGVVFFFKSPYTLLESANAALEKGLVLRLSLETIVEFFLPHSLGIDASIELLQDLRNDVQLSVHLRKLRRNLWISWRGVSLWCPTPDRCWCSSSPLVDSDDA